MNRRTQLFEVGLAFNAAMSDEPRKRLGEILDPPAIVNIEDLPLMLRPHRN